VGRAQHRPVRRRPLPHHSLRVRKADPPNQTLTDRPSQSAGAVSVDYYQYAYPEDPIAHAFIQESGVAQAFKDPAPADNLAVWFNASASLGCGGPMAGIANSLACMRMLPVASILQAIFIANPLEALLGTFGPTADGRTVFDDYSLRGPAGAFARKPLLVGNTFNEAGLFKVLSDAGGGTPVSAEDWALFNQAIFQCPTEKASRYRTDNRSPIYRYLYFGDFPNLALTANPPSGAYHTAEIPIVFQTTPDTVTVPSTTAELRISRFLSGAWAEFARNPYSGFRSPRYAFPPYNPLSPSLSSLSPLPPH
jgi:carboxylesterase type B